MGTASLFARQARVVKLALTVTAVWGLLAVHACGPATDVEAPVATERAALPPSGWQSGDVGNPPAEGGVTEVDAGVFQVTGWGRGVNDRSSDNDTEPDQMHFVYREVDAGDDVELVVRLNSFSGPRYSHAGVAIRKSTDGGLDSMGSASLGLNSCDPDPGSPNPPPCTDTLPMNKFFVTGRVDGKFWRHDQDTRVEPDTNEPVWLRLQKVGNDFYVSRSWDGQIWIPLQNLSGGEFTLTEAETGDAGVPKALVGFYVSSDDVTVTDGGPGIAEFEIDYIGDVRPDATTTWVGATFAKQSTNVLSWYMSGLYVDALGRAYKVAHDGESGHILDVFQDGQPLRLASHNIMSLPQGAVTGDPDEPGSIYLGMSGMNMGQAAHKVQKFDWTSSDSITAASSASWFLPAAGELASLAAGTGLVFVADHANDLITVLDADDLSFENEFDFVSPGAMAVDSEGRVWITQTSLPYPTLHGNFDLDPQAPAPVIKCYELVGGEYEPCGIQITGIDNPVAIAFDQDENRLLIADNGEDQQVLSYSLASQPQSPQALLGQQGGVYTGADRGRIHPDEPGDNYDRFYNLTGVGVDGEGNLYVGNGNRLDIRSFDAEGDLAWKVFGFEDPFDFDPAADGELLFSARERFEFDTTQSAAGTEWDFAGVTWDPFQYDEKQEDGRTKRRSGTPWVRHVLDEDDNPYRIMIVHGEQDPSDPFSTTTYSSAYAHDHPYLSGRRWHNIYRFDADDMAVPCGAISIERLCDIPGAWDIPGTPKHTCGTDPLCMCNLDGETDTGSRDVTNVMKIWIDGDGDGLRDEAAWPCSDDTDEVVCTDTPFYADGVPGVDEGDGGDVPPAEWPGTSIDADGGIWLNFPLTKKIWYLPRLGETTAGGPIYDVALHEGRFIDDMPTDGTPELTSIIDLDYDVGADVMYVLGNYEPGRSMIVRYEDWSNSSQRARVWTELLPTPLDEEDFISYLTVGDYVATKYIDLEVEGSKLFVAEHLGPVHVHEATTGAEVTRLYAGAEVSGHQTWNHTGIRALKRSDGEYLLAVSDVSKHGRTLVYRWNPGCTVDEDCADGEACNSGVCEVECDPNGAFGSSTSVLSGTTTADGITLMPGGLVAYISRYTNSTTGYDIYRSERDSTSDPFEDLTAVSGINSNADDRAPSLTTDGLTLYFWSKYNAPGGNGNLVMATRANTGVEFSSRSTIPGTGVNSDQSDEDPFFSAAAQALYFTSDRPGGDRDLWMLSLVSGNFVNPTKLTGVNTSNDWEEERRAILTADALTMYLHSDRLGFQQDTDGDIFIATRASTSNAFGTPSLVGNLNTSGREFPVALSANECTLYYASNKDTGGGNTQTFRLYQATRAAP